MTESTWSSCWKARKVLTLFFIIIIELYGEFPKVLFNNFCFAIFFDRKKRHGMFSNTTLNPETIIAIILCGCHFNFLHFYVLFHGVYYSSIRLFCVHFCVHSSLIEREIQSIFYVSVSFFRVCQTLSPANKMLYFAVFRFV